MQKYHFFTTRPLPICQEILPQKDSVRKILSAPTLTHPIQKHSPSSCELGEGYERFKLLMTT